MLGKRIEFNDEEKYIALDKPEDTTEGQSYCLSLGGPSEEDRQVIHLSGDEFREIFTAFLDLLA